VCGRAEGGAVRAARPRPTFVWGRSARLLCRL